VSIYDARQHFKADLVTVEPLTPARRREMTRRHLLDAAAAVFARDGYHGASLDDVAATAGFTKGAVYSNFKSKEDLFLAVLDDHFERERGAVQHALGEDVGGDKRQEQLPRVQGAIEQSFGDEWTALYLEFVLYARHNPALREKLAARARRQYDDTIGMLEAVYADIGAAPNHPMPVLARVSMALFEGLALGRLVDPESYTQETFTDALLFLYNTIGVDAPPEGEEGP
jgi:AcrR family transcriptional regulator